jgi:hypothetical protein
MYRKRKYRKQVRTITSSRLVIMEKMKQICFESHWYPSFSEIMTSKDQLLPINKDEVAEEIRMEIPSNQIIRKSTSSVKPSRDSSSERVILNVGGRRFETYVSTLTQYPDSLLGAMFSERNAELKKPDANGEYFFDRNPEAFEPILQFYRTGIFSKPQNISRQIMAHELEYWQIPIDKKVAFYEEDFETLGTNSSSLLFIVSRNSSWYIGHQQITK